MDLTVTDLCLENLIQQYRLIFYAGAFLYILLQKQTSELKLHRSPNLQQNVIQLLWYNIYKVRPYQTNVKGFIFELQFYIFNDWLNLQTYDVG